MTAPDHTPDVVRAMREFEFITLLDDESMLWFNGSTYRPNGESILKGWLEHSRQDEFIDPKLRGTSLKRDYVNEVLAAVKRSTYVDRSQLNPPGKLNFQNGWLELDTLGRGEPPVFWDGHNSQILFTTMLPYAYDPVATCPTFMKFIEEILPDPDDRLTVQKMFGYTLEMGNPHQVAFMLYGEGNRGKSTVLLVLTEMLGKENVASEPLQDLSDRRFAAASLYGKYANISADLPPNPMRYTTTFKLLTGGDAVKGEQKYKDAFSFINTAKLIFATNVLPQVNDDTYAFWRRWVHVDFTVDVTDHVDGHLIDKLRPELPGILNWSLRGLEALRKAGKFRQTVDALHARWMRESKPLRWFIEENVRTSPMMFVEKSEFYGAVVDFHVDHGFVPPSQAQVAKELPRLIPSIRSGKPRVDGKQTHAWMGIYLHTTVEPEEEVRRDRDVRGQFVEKGASQARLDEGEAGETGLPPLSHIRARLVGRSVEGASPASGTSAPFHLDGLTDEIHRKLDYDRGLQQMGRDAQTKWLAADAMLAHQFPEDLRPSVEEAVTKALDSYKVTGNPFSEGQRA